MKKQSLIKGTIVLGVAGVFTRFLGLFFRWPIIMLIGDEGVGYYQMSYPLYMFFIGLATGIPVAISKMISERNAYKDEAGMLQVMRTAMMTMLILGGGFSLIFLVFPFQIINLLKWDSKSLYSLMAIGAAPIFISIMSVYRGFFQGMQNMTPTALSQITEQVGRVIFGVGLAYILLPKGIEYSAGGAAFGAAGGGMLGAIYLSSQYRKFRKNFKAKKVGNTEKVLSELLSIAIPISLGAAVSTIMNVIDSILVPQKLLVAGYSYKEAAIIYGQLTGKAMVIINVPLTLSIALSASLVPIIAEAKLLNRKLELMNKVEMAIKTSIVIALPSLCGLFFLSYQVLSLIFLGHSEGYQILKYASLSIPFIILTQTTTSILQGTGNYIKPIINLAIGCIIKIIITLILVPMPQFNIYGAVIASLAAYFITTILNIIELHKKLGIRINYYETIIKPAYASVIMIIGVVFIYKYVYNNTMSNSIASLISIGLGGIFYIGMIIFLKVFEYGYVKNKLLKR
ncbi:polysaccharide biosynthesis protein [Clostridium sp. 19966]|uniref:putative polysaccharide biosynthesis protein n=1 Tax=Clostridium sp. 19966 TaxID=2768166 RepID=UPI0028DF555B|nr:polysaccharide biosynthesis protein [Clostridium sp. 19966]MDT8715743.1 polysaccharide biosynthesis protein [Clostridium sp. 19966]